MDYKTHSSSLFALLFAFAIATRAWEDPAGAVAVAKGAEDNALAFRRRHVVILLTADVALPLSIGRGIGPKPDTHGAWSCVGWFLLFWGQEQMHRLGKNVHMLCANGSDNRTGVCTSFFAWGKETLALQVKGSTIHPLRGDMHREVCNHFLTLHVER